MTAEQKQMRIEELLKLIEDKEKDIEGLVAGENINVNVESLKLEIVKEAFEKTKVDYNGEPIRPTELFGIYILEKEKLEKERDVLQAKVENETKKQIIDEEVR